MVLDEGKYFVVRTQLGCGHVLDVCDGAAEPGQQVFLWSQNGGDNQVWYEDHVTNSIRSKVDDNLVLQMNGDQLELAEFDPDESSQRWIISGDVIHNRDNPGWILDVADHNEDEGARVCGWDDNGGDNQRWFIEYLPPKLFFIRSEMNGKVMDVYENDPSPGTKVVMWDQKDDPEDNQLFYEDRFGVIRSALNDFALDTSGSKMKLQPYDPDCPSMQWMRSGNKIVNRYDPNMVLDIKKAKNKNKAKIIEHPCHDGDNQQWRCEEIE